MTDIFRMDAAQSYGTSTNPLVDRAPQRVIRRSCAAMLAMAALFAGLSPSQAVRAQDNAGQWTLANDTVVPLHDRRGKRIGSTTLRAGTKVQRVNAPVDAATSESVRLTHAGETFEIPQGAAYLDGLSLSNPPSTPGEKQVFDVQKWKKRNQMPQVGSVPEVPAPPKPSEFGPDIRMVPVSVPVPAADTADVPPNFAWDRTLILRDRFAFLALPFIKQTRPGICVGAAAINAVRHLSPEIQLSGPELFQLFCDRPAGATFSELEDGMMSLGFKVHTVPTRAMPRAALVRMVQRKLEQNLPILAADSRHMVLIYGFNQETKKLFVWNQWGNGKIINGMPKGTYELSESDLPIEFRYLFVIHKHRYDVSPERRESLEAITGSLSDLQAHPMIPASFRRSAGAYEANAIPQRIKAVLRAGRTLFLPQPDGNVVCVAPDDVDKGTVFVSATLLPSRTPKSLTLPTLASLITDCGGTFFSAADWSASSAPAPARMAGLKPE